LIIDNFDGLSNILEIFDQNSITLIIKIFIYQLDIHREL